MKLLVVFAVIYLSPYPNQFALGNAVLMDDFITIDGSVETTVESVDTTTEEINVRTTEETGDTTTEDDISITAEIADEPFICTNENLTLSFSNFRISTFGSGFIDSPLISCLNIENLGLTSIGLGAFNKMPNLRYLNLANNEIQPPKLFNFGSHSKLERLILNNQEVYNSYDEIVVKNVYPALRYLDLSRTKIRGLKGLTSSAMGDIVDNFPALTHLDLSYNNIENIDNFIGVSIFEKLTHLHLRGNSISFFWKENLNNLRVLSLDDNRIERISYKSDAYAMQQRYYYGNKVPYLYLYGLENLRRLTLTRNKIERIEFETFSQMTKLNYLDLSENKIKSAENLVNAESLRTLLINKNSLTDIPARAVPSKLTILSISCNQIEHLDPDTLSQYPHLKELYLAGNKIKSLDSSTFQSQTALEKLNLAHNELTYLPEGLITPLKNLRYLDVFGNRFLNLKSLSLRRSSPLQELYMQNVIKEIRASAIEALPENVTVYLYADDKYDPVQCKRDNPDNGDYNYY